MIATASSLLERLLPELIHAVISQDFGLKVALFVVTCLDCYLKEL
jgi:hypothetical protein